ncbi:mevalonate kinase-like [Ornithodoros turicata]|uniref:mevalonate kinase-like n=1 Tax=Ornithodoros turicata TaxID=34597 RepID=UPI0031386F8A
MKPNASCMGSLLGLTTVSAPMVARSCSVTGRLWSGMKGNAVDCRLTIPLTGTLFRIPPGYRVILVDTQVSRNTRSLVQHVRERYERLPSVVRPILEAIHAISERCWQLLREQADLVAHIGQASELIQMNANLLNALGVGHPRLDDVARIAADSGLTAKLTGAGGGGCAIILLPTKESATGIQHRLREAGFICWEASLGCPGVTLDTES